MRPLSVLLLTLAACADGPPTPTATPASQTLATRAGVPVDVTLDVAFDRLVGSSFAWQLVDLTDAPAGTVRFDEAFHAGPGGAVFATIDGPRVPGAHTYEIGVVFQANPDVSQLHRPLVRIVLGADGTPVAAPFVADLALRDQDGNYPRTIVKVTDPKKYGVNVGDHFV